MKNYKWWQDNERYIPDPWDEIAKFEQELKQMAITESALRECIEKLERENAALRADKERLDWLEDTDRRHGYIYKSRIVENRWFEGAKTVRVAIDAARKEQL
jgi:hypothetical protein